MAEQGGFFRHIGVVMSGTVVGQTINLLSYPIIARIYSPSDFGLFALFVSCCAIPGAIACLRFDLTIPTVSKGALRSAYWLCLLFAGAIGVVIGAIAAVAIAVFALGIPPWIPILLAAGVFLTGYCAASTMLLLRGGAYKITSGGIVLRTAASVAVQIAISWLLHDSLGLIMGYSAGLVAQAALLTIAIRSRGGVGQARGRYMKTVFQRYRRQVAVDVPSTLIGVASANVMAPVLIPLYGSGAAGVYALAFRIAVVPIQVFNDALAQVFFQKAAQAQRERGGFWPELRLGLIASSAVAAAVMLGVYLFAMPFVRIFLGETWLQSGEVLLILSPMIGFSSLSLSIATSVFVIKKVHWLLYLNIATIVIQLTLVGLTFLLPLGFTDFLSAVAILLAVAHLCFILILARSVRRRQPS